MIIKLFGGYQKIAGYTSQKVPGVTVRDGLERICKDNQTLREAIFNGSVLLPHVRILINGSDSELLQGLETNVNNEDQIAIFPPIAGG